MVSYPDSIEKQFLYYKMLGEKAMEQLGEEQLFWQYNQEANSIAILVNHMVGNMLSRFTDFLTTDGEKSWRNRDAEFDNPFSSKNDLMAYWDKGWACLIDALSKLSESDLETIVYIRNDGHTVIEAMNRQLAHYAYHIGQLVFIAKMLKNEEWKTLSIARNKSNDYNQRKFLNEKDKRHFTDDL
tara:strand:- start:3500 stop:4051 length:552 start_codon:yes stop_codon:yes gene_type:complete